MKATDKFPTIEKYTEYLGLACSKFGITSDQARDKYGLFTNAQWASLLCL